MKIPPEYDMIKVKRNFGLAITPTVIVLFQELERFNKLIRTITTTLTQLRKVPPAQCKNLLVLDIKAPKSFRSFRLSRVKLAWMLFWTVYQLLCSTDCYRQNGQGWLQPLRKISQDGWTILSEGYRSTLHG